MSDTTKQRLLEKELRQAQKTQASGYSVESKVQEIVADGILTCLKKPFTYNQLKGKIFEILREGHLPPEPVNDWQTEARE